MGPSTNDPSASWEVTRDSARPGMCSCRAVIRSTSKTSAATPLTAIEVAASQTGALTRSCGSFDATSCV